MKVKIAKSVEGRVVYVEEDFTETLENIEKFSQDIRAIRNERLSKTDWTQVPDAPVDQAAWRTYRQELRDIPSQEGFPTNIVWPTKPE